MLNGLINIIFYGLIYQHSVRIRTTVGLGLLDGSIVNDRQCTIADFVVQFNVQLHGEWCTEEQEMKLVKTTDLASFRVHTSPSVSVYNLDISFLINFLDLNIGKLLSQWLIFYEAKCQKKYYRNIKVRQIGQIGLLLF